jgi:TolA-binding protein
MLSLVTSRVGILVIASLLFALGFAYLQSVKADISSLEAEKAILVKNNLELVEINKNNQQVMKDMEKHIAALNEARLQLEKKRAETQRWTNKVIDQITAAKDEAPVSDPLRIAVDEIFKKVKK